MGKLFIVLGNALRHDPDQIARSERGKVQNNEVFWEGNNII